MGAPGGGGESKPMKIYNNLSYCYAYGYDVNHNGCKCHPITKKKTHIGNVSSNEAHTISGASMKL